jgi:hypothetical protein
VSASLAPPSIPSRGRQAPSTQRRLAHWSAESHAAPSGRIPATPVAEHTPSMQNPLAQSAAVVHAAPLPRPAPVPLA